MNPFEQTDRINAALVSLMEKAVELLCNQGIEKERAEEIVIGNFKKLNRGKGVIRVEDLVKI